MAGVEAEDEPTDTAEWLLERNAALAEEVEQIRAACKAQIDAADELSRGAMGAIADVVMQNAALHRQLTEAREAASQCCDGYEGQLQMLTVINRDLNRQLEEMREALDFFRDPECRHLEDPTPAKGGA